MPNGPCKTCGKGSMCKVRIGTISGCSEWSEMPQEARPSPAVSAQGAAVLPTTARQGGGKGGEKRGKGPNKTEAAYLKRLLSVHHDVRYEALTFKLASGHRYTPDFVVMFDGMPAECHEVKGSYKLHSHGRARLAFDSARVEFPGIHWVWAVKTKTGWECE